MITIGVDLRVLATGRRTGIECYAEAIVKHMIGLDEGISWKLYSQGGAGLPKLDWIAHPSVQVFEVGYSNRVTTLTSRLFSLPKLDSIVHGADVFFFPHFLFGALSSRCRRVTTWHDLSYERMPYLLSGYRRWWHDVHMRPRLQARLSDAIVAVSSATANDLVRLYDVDPTRVHTILSGVDASLSRASDAQQKVWRDAHAIDAPFIVALGTREPRKNLPALIRAWDLSRRDKSCDGLHLVIAGPPGWHESGIQQEIMRARYPEDVHCVGAVSPHERSALLSAATAVVYPSFMEGFGFPPLEAMACGTPVIASATSSLFETVGDAGVLIDPYRVDQLRDAICAVVSDQSLRARCIDRGIERVQTFTWQRAARQTLTTLLSVLK